MDPASPYRVLPRRRGFLGWLRLLAKGALILLVILIALIFLGYAYVDISGSWVWATARKHLVAQGFSLDPKSYIPPPVPDAENLAALPIFQLQPNPAQPGTFLPIAWTQAFGDFSDRLPSSSDDGRDSTKLPYLTSWHPSNQPDMDAARQWLVDLCAKVSPPISAPPGASATELLGLLYPVLAELRKESAARPACRFNFDRQSTSSQDFWVITKQILLAKILSYEETLALDDQQSQLALADFKVGWNIDAALEKEPALVVGLVTIGCEAIEFGVLRQCLARHSWSDAQLLELDSDIQKLDNLTQAQHVIRGEFVVYSLPLMERYTSDRRQLIVDMRKEYDDMQVINKLTVSTLKSALAKDGDKNVPVASDDEVSRNLKIALSVAYWWPPNGELKSYMADYARIMLPLADEVFDPAAHRVHPEKLKDVPENAGFLAGMANAIKKFSYAQVQIDEARVACRLERYWLVHHAYPATLDELVPAFGADLPQDITTGEPYHYRREGDSYLLYSVGWDQKDDGGNPSTYFGSESPDWVWPNHPLK